MTEDKSWMQVVVQAMFALQLSSTSGQTSMGTDEAYTQKRGLPFWPCDWILGHLLQLLCL